MPNGQSPRRHMISSQDYSAKIKDTEEKLKHLEDLQTQNEQYYHEFFKQIQYKADNSSVHELKSTVKQVSNTIEEIASYDQGTSINQQSKRQVNDLNVDKIENADQTQTERPVLNNKVEL